MDYGEFGPLDPDTDPVLLYSVGEPRIIDTIFNVSSLTSGIFNNSLLQYAGVVIVGIILFGKQLISERLNCEFCYETLCCEGGLLSVFCICRDCAVRPGCLLQSNLSHRI